MKTLRFLACTLAILTSLPTTQADPPHVSYIFPAGGQRGTTVSFRVGGHNLYEGCPFEFSGPGVSAAKRIERTETTWFEGPVIPQPASQRKEDYPKDYAGSLDIAADTALGSRYWRVSTSQGVTPRMKFQVGDLPEVVEREIDGDPVPVVVTLPVTINGRIFPREDVDIWTFDAKAGQRISCEVFASRLGSPLDSRLEIRGPDGQMLTQNVDTFGTDSLVQFEAPVDGTYECRIHDINFNGLQDHVYRLTIRSGAYIRWVYPLGGKRGESVSLTLSGLDVPDQPVAVAIPATAGAIHHWQMAGKPFASNPVRLLAGDLDEHREAEPNDLLAGESSESVPAVATKVTDIKIPAALNGQINGPGDTDLWRFTATEGQSLIIEVFASRLGTPLDAVLSVLSSDLKQLALNDDVKGGVTDSRLSWKVPKGEHFYLQIRDQFTSRGGDEFAYRIHITEAVADTMEFALTLPADAITVTAGDEAGAKVKLDVDRSAGYKGEIEITAEGLPEGVTLEGTAIGKNKPNTTLVFKATEKTKIGLANIRIIGRSTEPDTDIVSTAHFPGSDGETALTDIAFAVALKTPFKFFSPFETKYASRGTVYGRNYQIDRGGFEGPIEVEMADRQTRHLQGVTGPKVIVPPGKSEFYYAISLPPWMEIGRTSRSCLIVSAIVESADGSKHRVSYSSQTQDDQIICLVDPVRLSVDTPRKTLGVRAGETVQLPVTVGRGTGLTGPVTVQLRSAIHVRGWSSEPVEISADATQATLPIQFAAEDLGPFNAPLILEATIQDARGMPVKSECPIRVRLLDSQASSAR